MIVELIGPGNAGSLPRMGIYMARKEKGGALEIQESPSFLEFSKEFVNLFWLLSLALSVCRVLVLRGCHCFYFLIFVWFVFACLLFGLVLLFVFLKQYPK